MLQMLCCKLVEFCKSVIAWTCGHVLTLHLLPQARLDSLVKRSEAIGSKTIEKFEGRDDHLVYRSTRYGSLEPQQSDLR